MLNFAENPIGGKPGPPLQVFLLHLQKFSIFSPVGSSYTSWCQRPELEANTECFPHAQTRLAEGYLCLIFYL